MAASETSDQELTPSEIDAMMAEAKALDEYFQRSPFSSLQKRALEKLLADCLEPAIPPPVT